MSAFSYFLGLNDLKGLLLALPADFSVVVDRFKGSKSSRCCGAGLAGLYGTGLATTLYLDS